MVTQEPHLCENCGHIDPLELPYCGFCGHPNVTATDEQREAHAADTALVTPSAGTAAAAADLADLITAPATNQGSADPEGAVPAPADSDFEFNAGVAADLEVPESIASELGDIAAVAGVDPVAAEGAVHWGDPGEFAPPSPPIDPFAEDFTASAAASAPVSDPVQEALLTGAVPAGVTIATPTMPPGGGDVPSTGTPSSGGRGGRRSRTMLLLVGLIILAVVIAVVIAVAGGGSNKPPSSASNTTTSSPSTPSTTGTHNSTPPVIHGAVIAGTSSAPWTNVVYPAQYASGHLFTMSCATANACFAVGASQTGAEILSTLDGGTTWNNDTYPSSTNLQNNGHLFSIYCATASACEAVGTAPNGAASQLVIMGTTDAGNTWVSQTYPSSLTNGHLFSVYSASATVCWALGGQSDGTPIILATTDGGSNWALQSYPSGLNLAGSGFLSIGCPSTQHCIISAAGNGGLEILTTNDGGTTWTTAPLPSGVVTMSNGIGSASCGTKNFCVITGFSNGTASGNPPIIVSTDDGGSTWKVDPYPSSLGLTTLTGVWCTGPSDCWALGDAGNSAVIVATTDAGKTWALQHYPLTLGKNDLVSLSCPTTSTCWIVGVSSTNTPVVLAARKS